MQCGLAFSVQCLNSTYDSKNIDDGSGGSDVRDVASGADRHLDITLISDCRWFKLIPCFRNF